jgi:hypothetical protein
MLFLSQELNLFDDDDDDDDDGGFGEDCICICYCEDDEEDEEEEHLDDNDEIKTLIFGSELMNDDVKEIPGVGGDVR